MIKVLGYGKGTLPCNCSVVSCLKSQVRKEPDDICDDEEEGGMKKEKVANEDAVDNRSEAIRTMRRRKMKTKT